MSYTFVFGVFGEEKRTTHVRLQQAVNAARDVLMARVEGWPDRIEDQHGVQFWTCPTPSDTALHSLERFAKTRGCKWD